jgi:hypothetical protein
MVVGGVRSYNIDNLLNDTNKSLDNINPNGENDTKLGELSKIYLSSTLQKSEQYNKSRTSFPITRQAYNNFGIKGEFGIGKNSYLKNGMPIQNEVFLQGAIKYTPIDYPHIFNFTNVLPSYDLYNSASKETQGFISKSMLGYNLSSPIKTSLNVIGFSTRKKYFATLFSKNDYITRITNDVYGIDTLIDIEGRTIFARINTANAGNTTLSVENKQHYIYDEGIVNGMHNHNGVAFNSYQVFAEPMVASRHDIINFTNKQFANHKYNTLIGRFCTGENTDPNDITSSAVSKYGLSRGRNLLKKKVVDTNDPYCRVWTYHKQYSQYNHLIRPFIDESATDLSNVLTESGLQVNRKHLTEYGVKTSLGLVRFAPSDENNIKKCMFSIENLAWRNYNTNNDTSFHKGPNEGRIMWFPPYDLKFNEQVSTNWNANQFIGRGEKIYSYVDSERNGTLSFKLLIDHPSLIDKVYKSSVSTMDNDEQDILRFFAGCDIITNIPTKQKEENKNENVQESISLNGEKQSRTLQFSIYFPNCYSGYDDGYKNAISYLLYGIGCDIVTGDTVFDRGYEIGESGLTYDGKWDNENKITITKGEEKYIIKGILYQQNYWGYLVDNDLLDSTFKHDTSYVDNKSFKLNATSSSAETNDILTTSFCDFCRAVGDYNVEGGDKETQGIIQQLFKSYKVAEVRVIGYSNSQGNKGDNETLAQRRKEVITKWLQSKTDLKNASWENGSIQSNVEISNSEQDANTQEAKATRKVDVKIIFSQDATIKDLSSNQSQGVETISSYTDNASKGLNSEEKVLDSNTIKVANITSQNKVLNEYEFFKEFGKGDSLLRNKIVEKIKYFDPAFHSITPEGFNARLTFLHQCTRQGQTIDIGKNEHSVRNMAFGAPPICVLRIGDFYNTKIIIKNIDISYDESTWDLNDEGIGVMPMMADITISFTFIGGSDISGPISRLQNAVSFNYYANTSVYENKADIRQDKKK